MTRRVPLWLALPAIAGLVLFLVYPTGYLLALALTDSSLAHPLRIFSGGDNVETALAVPAFVPSLWKSTAFAVLATVVTTALGLALALRGRARPPIWEFADCGSGGGREDFGVREQLKDWPRTWPARAWTATR